MQEQTAEFIQNTNALAIQISNLVLSYSLSTIGAIIILSVGWIIAGILQRWTRQSLSKFKGFDQTLVVFFSASVRYGILVVVLVMVLGQFGIQTASILAALGAVGLAIGLALQGTLQNIAAGIMLLVLRPFKVGEYINAGAIAGTVQEIGLFSTELKTYDGLFVMAPNSVLWNTPVTNFTRHKARMHDFKVGIGYEDDVQKAFTILKTIISEQKGVLKTPEPIYFVSQLADSSVVISCRYWIEAPNYFTVSNTTTERVKSAFSDEGINIPYPQVTYHRSEVTS
ncbi:mechanosensitive ion channel [Pseudochrobactrum algeriensis]|uniref:Small-conductance mechanosensitive channel n=1 Tax=Pseudochrobactrum saccharolyticum TaxID=354352 RepID=A0A7W8AKP9_9HYPH|nr:MULTISPECIES: mechanosensitive ion channel domain-containing protein [Pseudochrobactrum]MBX8782899.1 mechanosensitive ion channel [Ochrobactrum sp. GRS2]MBX8811161.1 mechanosensitive ion channel [Ochrobactrum sp. MR34]KAB0538990.1 mechanosensitive ion channel [Pseudochrobactrum saccharolyticum]MBB5091015.1 small conductance mechanosensitive channel [Pseudochrobactrum saccharolyticum]MDP8249724.1 mechanosensitive ion channel [Pseudochrobactrum saccharolyticum]